MSETLNTLAVHTAQFRENHFQSMGHKAGLSLGTLYTVLTRWIFHTSESGQV